MFFRKSWGGTKFCNNKSKNVEILVVRQPILNFARHNPGTSFESIIRKIWLKIYVDEKQSGQKGFSHWA